MDSTTQTPNAKDRRFALPYSLPGSLHDELERRALVKFEGNRSEAAEHYILLGFEAERKDRPKEPVTG